MGIDLSPDTPEQLVESFAAVVPAGENPYSFILSYYSTAVFAADSPAKRPLFIAVSVLACIPVLLLFASIAVRWRKGSLWFFRIVTTKDGTRYVLPHHVTSWSCWLIVLCAVLQISIWSQMQDRINSPVSFFENLREPVFLAFSFALWTLSVSYILHIKTFHSSSTSFLLSPYFVHILAVLVPCAHFTTTVVLASRAMDVETTLIETLSATLTALYAESGSWDGSSLPTVEDAWVDPGFRFMRAHNSFSRRFNTLLWWYACSCLSIGLILVIVAISYIRAITLQMQSCAPSSMTVWRSVDFARTRRSLVFVTTAFIFVLGIIVAVIFAEASLGRHLYEEQIASLVGQSLAFYVPVVASIPVSVILLVRALRDPAKAPPSSRHTISHKLSIRRPINLDSFDPPRTPSIHLDRPHPFSIGRLALPSTKSQDSVLALDFLPTSRPSGLDDLEVQIAHPNLLDLEDGIGSQPFRMNTTGDLAVEDGRGKNSRVTVPRRAYFPGRSSSRENMGMGLKGVSVTKETVVTLETDELEEEEDGERKTDERQR